MKTVLGLAWIAIVVFTAWYVYKHFRPGFMK